jgi:hypothetical protein
MEKAMSQFFVRQTELGIGSIVRTGVFIRFVSETAKTVPPSAITTATVRRILWFFARQLVFGFFYKAHRDLPSPISAIHPTR